jgi:hypothetical protein
LPFDPLVVKTCDEGTPIATHIAETPFVQALDKVVQAIVAKL